MYDELTPSIHYLSNDPTILKKVLLMATIALSTTFFNMLATNTLGSYHMSLVSATKKMLIIVSSILVYGHRVDFSRMSGIGLVMVGVWRESFSKSKGGKDKKKIKDKKE